MRIISLNTWGGRLIEPLLEFFAAHRDDTDIFCLQEILHNATNMTPDIVSGWRTHLTEEIAQALPRFHTYFDGYQIVSDKTMPNVVPVGSVEFGNVMFVHPRVRVCDQSAHMIYRERNAHMGEMDTLPRNMQLLHTTLNNHALVIANMHGLWIPNFGKGDHESRLAQSRKVHDILQNVLGSKILVGDLNLSPDTESLKILGEGMRNLIDEYHIPNTRSSHYQKSEKFADYAFVSPDLNVVDFKVLSDEVSDHLPLQLDIM